MLINNNNGTFAVEIRIAEEITFSDRVEAMRQWLDHQRIEPTTFRGKFDRQPIIIRVEFAVHADAVAFAEAFGGQVR